MRELVTLIKKDCLLEFRSFETLVAIIGNAILVAAIAAAGISSSFLDSARVIRVFPFLLWMLFLLIATISISRGNDAELEHRGFEGLLLAGARSSLMFVSKVISSSAVFFIGYLVLLLSLLVLLGVDARETFSAFILLGVVAIPSFASLAVLMLGVASVSKLKGVLLTLILLPLLFPLFFACTEISANALEPGINSSSSWWALLALLDIIYLVLGINLYGYVLVE